MAKETKAKKVKAEKPSALTLEELVKQKTDAGLTKAQAESVAKRQLAEDSGLTPAEVKAQAEELAESEESKSEDNNPPTA
jgi:hypothetical protein